MGTGYGEAVEGWIQLAQWWSTRGARTLNKIANKVDSRSYTADEATTDLVDCAYLAAETTFLVGTRWSTPPPCSPAGQNQPRHIASGTFRAEQAAASERRLALDGPLMSPLATNPIPASARHDPARTQAEHLHGVSPAGEHHGVPPSGDRHRLRRRRLHRPGRRVQEGRQRPHRHRDGVGPGAVTLDERAGIGPAPDAIGQLLDQAVQAINAGDLATAHDLAGQVLRREAGNTEAADLLATGTPPAGELRRLTIMSCDLVGSTELSERLEPEPYHALVRSYRARAREIIEGRYDAHITSVTGDGIFALFGYPSAHEDDAVRAVKAAMDVCRMVEEISARAESAVGEALTVRAAVHRGMVLIDEAEADVYGLAANVTARLQGVATPGPRADLGSRARPAR